MFERAEKLHMTVGEMSERMSFEELEYWAALDSLRVQEREKAERLAKKGMNTKRPRRR